MTDPVKAETAKKQILGVLDKAVAELTQLKQEQLSVKSNRGWCWCGTAIRDVNALRSKVETLRP